MILDKLGMTVKLAHTAKTKAIAEERIKTDKLSAHVLADLLRTNLLPEAYRPLRHVRDSRQLIRYRLWLINLRSGLKKSIHSILSLHGIQQPFTDLFGSKGRGFLDQLALPEPYGSIVNNYLSLIDNLTERINKVDALLRRNLKSDPQAQLLNTIPGIGIITTHLILA